MTMYLACLERHQNLPIVNRQMMSYQETSTEKNHQAENHPDWCNHYPVGVAFSTTTKDSQGQNSEKGG